MKNILRPALVLFLLLTLITGVAYPLVVTGVAKMLFPEQAAGSLVLRDGKPVGSVLIGQNFSDPKHFWGRPSATGPMPYNAAASGGSNQGPLNPALTDAVKGRVDALRAADPGNTAPVPVDLVTASASGLDPHISPAAARYQSAASPKRADCHLKKSRVWWMPRPRRPYWVFWASHGSMSSSSIWRWRLFVKRHNHGLCRLP